MEATRPAAPRASASLTLDPWVSINTIRVLAMDAVEQANSGHPGTPMALAPVAYLLWTRHLRHNPADPAWEDRDRFVLSCGHASMLLYSLLHLSGYDLPLDEIRNFRQWHSRTPGHPERGHTPGVEVTTGPLGQGIGNAVGMAMAERFLAARFNKPDAAIVDHRTWALVSDGDLMEGVASEAASLAGHLKLGKLALIYDDNRITIDGNTGLSFSEDASRRFEGYGWRVLHVADGNDLEAIDTALTTARNESERPTLIVLRTVIADPAPTKRNTSEAHGAPLGAEEVRRTKGILGWAEDQKFVVPDAAYADMGRAGAHGAEAQQSWRAVFERYRAGTSRGGERVRARAARVTCPRDGIATCRPSPPTRAAWRRGRRVRRRCRQSCRTWETSSAGRPTWPAAPAWARSWAGRSVRAWRVARCTGVSASTRWARA